MEGEPGEPAESEADAGPSEVTAGERDRFVQVLLNSFERGLLEPAEYEHRLELLEAAGSMAEMKQVIQEMVIVGMPTTPTAATTAPTSAPAPPAPVLAAGEARTARAGLREDAADLDPIDLALMEARTPVRGGGNNRVKALVAVVVVFVALMVVGAYLITKVQPNSAPNPDVTGISVVARG